MLPFQKILFPIDFSDAPAALVPYVAEMSQRFGATVTVLNAFHLIHDYRLAISLEGSANYGRAVIPYTEGLQELRKERRARLDDFASSKLSGVAHTVRMEDGDPATVIEWVTQNEASDLIMMPTKGLGKFRRFLLGSVTAKVLHDVSCPVWTSAHVTESDAPPAGGYRSIVCAVELNSEAHGILETAAFLAQTYGARLCLLHVAASHEDASTQPVKDAFENALKLGGQKLGPEISLRISVVSMDGRIADSIRRTAMEESADLLVVGRGRQKMWSHLYKIVTESPCPVLSV